MAWCQRRRRSEIDLYGVIGYPIGHSLSPEIHQQAFTRQGKAALYIGVAVRPDQLAERLKSMWAEPWQGFNVTVPHKEAVLPLLAAVSEEAARIGAVNAVVRRPEGWFGMNTDLAGFLAALPHRAEHALVLGAGGAAKAVIAGLDQQGTRISVSTRNPDRLTLLADRRTLTPVPWTERHRVLPEVDLVVNATPLGQAPEPKTTPLDHLDGLAASATVYDLVYRPTPTRLLRKAAEAGCQTVSGVEMLAAQAALSWQLWFGEMGPREEFLTHLHRILAQEAGGEPERR